MLSRKVELDLHLTEDRLENNLFVNNPFKGGVRWTQEAPDSVHNGCTAHTGKYLMIMCGGY